LKRHLPHSFYSLLSPRRQPIPADSARILQTRVDACRNAKNTLVFAGKRKSRAPAEQRQKVENGPRVNRVPAPLVRNRWGNLGRRCDGAFPARRARAEWFVGKRRSPNPMQLLAQIVPL